MSLLNSKAIISLDVSRDKYITVPIKQYDINSRQIIAKIIDNGAEIKLDGTIVPRIKCKKNDGKYVINDCIVLSDGCVQIDITEQMTTAEGACLCELALFDSESNKVLHTMNFIVNVKEAPFADNEVTSSDEFIALENALLKVDELGRNLEEYVQSAKDSADKADEYEANAKESSANADTYEENAKISASNASTSATHAADYESQALKSKNNILSYESISLKSKDNILSYESTSNTSKNNILAFEQTASEYVDTINGYVNDTKNSAEQADNMVQELSGTLTEIQNNEKQRQLNESQRISSENQRVTNETARQNEESKRVSNENQRTTAENTRESNENTRQNNEEIRQTGYAEMQKTVSTMNDTLSSHISDKSNPHDVTIQMLGYGNIDNTSDMDKPVSTAQRIAIDNMGSSANSYTDTKIADLIGGAPSTLDTLKEVADAMLENKTVVDALNKAIGTKAEKSDLDSHTSDTTSHITSAERSNWNDSNSKKHTHSNKSILDTITSSLISGWNNAVEHISDTVKHITSSERTLWNTVSNKVDKVTGKGLSTNDYTTAEKNKLGGIASGAEVNQNAFSNVKVGSTTVSADSKTDTLEIVAGSNITLTPDATNDKLTIAATDTVYTHPTTSGNKHIPSGGSSGQILRWSADGTAVWGNDNNTTYSVFKAATASTAGGTGLVPAPAAGKQGTFLRGDGTWASPANTTYSTGTATSSGLTKLYTGTGSATDGTMTQKAITSALDGIEIGGRNLIRNSNFSNKTSNWTADKVYMYTEEDPTYKYMLVFKGASSSTPRIYNSVTNVWKAGETYTVSYYAKSTENNVTIQPSRSVADWGEKATLTTSWKKYVTTIKSTVTAADGTLSFTIRNLTATFYITNVKLEIGNKATDWTPAPEDVESSINTLSDKYTDIKQTVDGISTTVASHTTQIANKADGSTVTTVSNKVASLEQNLNGFKTTVSEDYTTKTEFNELQIGGRNLLINTHRTLITYKYPDSGTIDKCQWKTAIPLNGDTYTLSFWAKSTVSGDKIRVHFYNPSNIISAIGSQGQKYWNGDGLCDFTLTTTIMKYWVTYKIPKGGNSTRNVIIPRLISGNGTGTISIQWEKLEEGNKATDWTPAPEDIDSSISSLENTTTTLQNSYTVLNQTLNSLSATVTSNSTEISKKADGTALTTLKDTVVSMQADLSGYKTTVSNTYSTKKELTDVNNKFSNYSTTTQMNSAIDQKANSITNTVSATYTTKAAFNSLTIGGRNLAQSTSKNYSNAFSDFTGGTNICPGLAKVLTDGLSVGDTVTVRLVYKYTDITAVSGKTASCLIQGSGNTTSWSSGAFNYSPKKTLSGSGEHIFLHSFTITENHLKNTYWNVNIRHDYVQSGSVQWKMFKVEKGNKATDWTPAPEDVERSIASVSSKVENHTHNYAGSSTPGGAATSAEKCTGNSATATKATQDSAGQQINTTYIKELSVNGRTITYTKGDGTTGTITTQDTNTTYGVATTSSNGLMSSTDKSKLDGIAIGANKTTVDSALSSTSTNPVQNKVINSALDKMKESLEQNTKGKFELPNGLKICWGRYTPPNANGYVRQGTVTFPITFSSPPYVFCTKAVGNTAAECVATVGCQNQTVTNAVIKAMSANGTAALTNTEIPINWIAIGY